jgi:uncharacterized protein (DUF4415 family)
MKKANGRLAREVNELRQLRDEQIDLSDIPETADWSKAVVGKFYRPLKKSLTIRVDADVLAWLRNQGKGYQTRINALLRKAMESAISRHHSIRLTESSRKRAARRA